MATHLSSLLHECTFGDQMSGSPQQKIILLGHRRKERFFAVVDLLSKN
jgi:hypothetical protein